MAAREQRRAQPDAPLAAVVIGLIAAFFAAFLLASFTMTSAKRVASGLASQGELLQHFGMVLGIALVGALVLWGVIYLAFIRRSRPAWGGPYLAVIGALMLTLSVAVSLLAGMIAERREQERVALAEIHRVVSAFTDDGLQADFSNTRPKARGEPGEMERLVKESVADAVGVARKYDADIKALKLDNMTSREIANGDMDEIKGRLRKATSLTVDYGNAVDDIGKRIAARADASEVSEYAKRRYLREFQQGFAAGKVKVDQVLELQLSVIDLTSEQLDFLQSNRGAWVVQGGGFAFRNQPALDNFNGRALEIQNATAEMQAIQRAQMGRMVRLRDETRAESQRR